MIQIYYPKVILNHCKLVLYSVSHFIHDQQRQFPPKLKNLPSQTEKSSLPNLKIFSPGNSNSQSAYIIYYRCPAHITNLYMIESMVNIIDNRNFPSQFSTNKNFSSRENEKGKNKFPHFHFPNVPKLHVTYSLTNCKSVLTLTKLTSKLL